MSDVAVNGVIDQLIGDEVFYARLLAEGSAALDGLGLSDHECDEIVAAARSDASESRGVFASLRTVARFTPLFAAASASATKVG